MNVLFTALPQHPAITATAGWPFTVFYLTIAVIALIPTLIWCRRNRNMVPVAMLIGGLFVSLVEALLDQITLVYWPPNIPLTAYTLVERPVPLALVVGYGVYCGISAWIVSRWLDSALSRRHRFIMPLALYGFDLVFEIPWLIVGTYIYYGRQPLKFGPLPPLYWPLMNVALVFVTAWLYLQMKRAWPQRSVTSAFISPLLAIGTIFTVGWPVFSALNSTAGSPVILLCALVTVTLSITVITLVIRHSQQTTVPTPTAVGV